MTLPASGGNANISFSAIYIELGLGAPGTDEDISIAEAATGIYATINTSSSSYPNASQPHGVGEWGSYDHNASAGAPVASFTISDSTPNVNQTVTFTDTSTNTPTSWSWTITGGDYSYVNSTSSISQNPQVQFKDNGLSYTVNLQATNGSGSNNTSFTNNITTNETYSTLTIGSGLGYDAIAYGGNPQQLFGLSPYGSTYMINTYRNTSDDLQAQVLTHSNGTYTSVGSEITLNTRVGNGAVENLNGANFVAIYRNNNISGNVYARGINASSAPTLSTLTSETSLISNSSTNINDIEKLTTNKVAYVAGQGGTGNKYAGVVYYNGSTLSGGSNVISTADAGIGGQTMSIAVEDSTHFAVFYTSRSGGVNNTVKAKYITVSGTVTLSASSESSHTLSTSYDNYSVSNGHFVGSGYYLWAWVSNDDYKLRIMPISESSGSFTFHTADIVTSSAAVSTNNDLSIQWSDGPTSGNDKYYALAAGHGEVFLIKWNTFSDTVTIVDSDDIAVVTENANIKPTAVNTNHFYVNIVSDSLYAHKVTIS